MPQFRTTYNILKTSDENEAFNPNWMDSDTVVLPPKVNWDYSRDLHVEDIDYWEVLYESSGGIGFYAAWLPYAEYFLLTTGVDVKNGPQFRDRNLKTAHIPHWDKTFETFYGPNAEIHAVKRARDFGVLLNSSLVWVDDSEMWLHQELPQEEKSIILL
jgi:hypothetical protein